MKLWETDKTETEEIVENYTASEDVQLDQKLVQDDIIGNIAHTQMLYEEGFLNKKELSKIHSSLLELLDSDLKITPEDEDVHSKIENLVTEKTESGKKIHTARSRNDQVLLDTRLFSKRKIIDTAINTLKLIKSLHNLAKKHEDLIMPGYTHMRQAMPMKAYLWLTSYIESLLDDLELLETSYRMNNQNPLGAAAGYGTSLEINRKRTTELLNFEKIQENPLYCVNSRGKTELNITTTLSQIMLDLNKLSNDLILFSTHEYNFIKLPEEFTTGSSIMPQKSNPDVLEILKGKTSDVISKQHQIELTLKNSNLGYNRDTQETKKSLIQSIKITNDSIKILNKMIPEIKFKKEEINKKMKKSINAAYTANKKVKKGTPFREAYKQTKQQKNYQKPTTKEINNYKLNNKKIKKQKQNWNQKKKQHQKTIQKITKKAKQNTEK